MNLGNFRELMSKHMKLITKQMNELTLKLPNMRY